MPATKITVTSELSRSAVRSAKVNAASGERSASGSGANRHACPSARKALTDSPDAGDVPDDPLPGHLGLGAQPLEGLDRPVPEDDGNEHLVVVQHEVVDAGRRDRRRVRG